MATSELEENVAAVRRFNRFFTQKIGVLHKGLLDSPYSLTEVRLMYELAHRDAPTAAELSEELGIDPGYLSRMLRRFEREKLLKRRKSSADARRTHLSLTARGRKVFAGLDRRSHDEVRDMISVLDDGERSELVTAMQQVETLLRPVAEPLSSLIRPHRNGDLSWVIWRHSVFYQGEFGWSDRFMAVVARAVAQFIDTNDARHERCWIAEHGGRRVGSVFLVRETDELARLRLLLVEPEARGLGLGRRLVEECITTARELGYRRMTLWTNSELHAARRIYESFGFQLMNEKPYPEFAPDFVGQDWELDLEKSYQPKEQ